VELVMSSGQEAGGEKQPRQISTIKDLFESLIAPDAATRLETLQAIQTQPHAALSFGLYQGHDVIDVLLAGATSSLTSTEWMSWLGTLAAFRDDRVTDFFLNVLPQEESPQLIFSAARYLAGGDLRPARGRLLAIVLQNENPTRARAVAPLLQSAPRLSPTAKLRIALLCDLPAEPIPPIDETNLELWLAELAGPFWQDAQVALKTQGERAWTTLAQAWGRLTEDNQLWLLQWGSEACSGKVAGLIPGALGSKVASLRVEALRVMATLQENEVPASIAALALPLLEDPEPQIRQAAALAAPAGLDWRALLARETVPAVRRALVLRLAWAAGEESTRELAALLRSDDWQIRAICAGALARVTAPE
jgi:hypothetical protein